MIHVYLLRSTADDGFYIGFSTDLKRSLSEPSWTTKSRLMKPCGAEIYGDQAMQLGRVRDHRLGYQHAWRTHVAVCGGKKMSAKIIAVDELATSRMLATCSSPIPKLPQGMRCPFCRTILHGVRCPHGVGPFPAFSTGLLAKWLA
jgi:hypothetical protein